MTDWSLEPMDITKCWVSSLEMLCQAFTSVAACLWAFLPSVLSSLSENHAQLGWDQVTDSAIEEYYISLPWKPLGLLSQYVLGHYSSALWGTFLSFCSILLNLSRYHPIHFRIRTAASISSHIINKHQGSNSTGSNTYQCHNTVSTMCDRWCYFPSPFSSLPIILVQVNLGFICLKNPVPETLCIHIHEGVSRL